MSTSAGNATVLMVGDVLIDRSWVVGDSPTKRQFTPPHYSVYPRELVDADKNTDVLGGVGTIARAVIANDPNATTAVTVAGVWNEIVQRELDRLVPAETAAVRVASAQDRISFIRLGSAQVSSMRLRIYEPSPPKGVQLLYRFDRDWPVPRDFALRLNDLPAADAVRFVVLGDYGNNLLAHGDLIAEMKKRYEGKETLLRSASRELIESYPWTILSLDLRRLAILLDIDPLELPVTRGENSECRFHPALLDALEAFDRDFRKGRTLLLNLEPAPISWTG